MSTDRELLELAAKAAGIQIDYSTTNGGGQFNTGFDVMGNAVLDWYNDKNWNPLTDDGDALRLAVLLRLDIHCDGDACAALYGSSDGPICFEQKCHGDHFAGVRRAIVRAAADIGRSMP